MMEIWFCNGFETRWRGPPEDWDSKEQLVNWGLPEKCFCVCCTGSGAAQRNKSTFPEVSVCKSS